MTIQTDLIKPAISLPEPAIHRTGTDMAVDLLKMGSGIDRDEYIVSRILEGHVPTIVTSLKPVEIKFEGALSGKDRKITIFVTGDYMSIGDDLDYIRVPLNPLSTQALFDTLGLVLPTVKLVNDIWKASDIKLDPLPWGPPYDASMMSSDRLVKHSHKIDNQLNMFSKLSSKLIVGHKKDVVITNRLKKQPKQLAIFGWHQKDGKQIQPLYLGHENTYRDYSHGERGISREIWCDTGLCFDIVDAMIDSEIYPAFGDDPSEVWRQPNL